MFLQTNFYVQQLVLGANVSEAGAGQSKKDFIAKKLEKQDIG